MHLNVPGASVFVPTELQSTVAFLAVAGQFNRTVVIMRNKSQRTREIAEAYEDIKSGDACVSQPSISLSADEAVFLGA